MKINPEAQLAVKLYNRLLTKPDHSPYHIPLSLESNQAAVCSDAARLMSMARALSRLDEAACNRELTRREFNRVSSLGAGIRTVLDSYRLTWTHVCNAGKHTVAIYFPDGSHNMTTPIGDEAWGI